MATLRSRGRRELVRLVRDRAVSDSPVFDRERVTIAFMSDGVVLRKWDVWFIPNEFEATRGQVKSKIHSYGWKVKSRFNQENLEARVAAYVAAGFVKGV